MSLMTPALPNRVIEYPDDDGKPMANNSEQGKWIVVLYGNLGAVLQNVVDVYLAVDHLWYPVEGHPEIVCTCSRDVMVVFGRRRGKRGSYMQWQEENIPVTVAFEILSPGNDLFEMADKLAFYDEYGVEEYYLYDPEGNRLAVYVRRGQALRREWQTNGFVSPRLGIRFDLSGPELVVFYPDGRRFRTFEELEAELHSGCATRQHRRTTRQHRRTTRQHRRATRQHRRATCGASGGIDAPSFATASHTGRTCGTSTIPEATTACNRLRAWLVREVLVGRSNVCRGRKGGQHSSPGQPHEMPVCNLSFRLFRHYHTIRV